MSSRFQATALPLAGLTLLQRSPFSDERGFLDRLFCADELASFTGGKALSQINHTLTVRAGAVRGLHFQRQPHTETKIVTCVRGRIFDVAVDLREGSPTYLHWHGELLSATNQRTLVIPDGFAHGFQTLEENSEILYLVTAPYRPESEGGIRPDDPALAIAWPLPIAQLSARDSGHPLLAPAFRGVSL